MRFGPHLSRNFLDKEVDLIVVGCGFYSSLSFAADSATTFADSARPNYQRSLTRLLIRVR